jgi:shikimate dehydrogenase
VSSPKARFGVVGNPIKQSRSPQIHTCFAEQFEISNFCYEGFAVDTTEFESFADQYFLERISDGLTLGLNITVPFKVQALEWAQRRSANISARAALAGAVNTLGWTAARGLFADNTDGVGLVRDITTRWQFDLQAKHVLIVGAGGATRGILLPLIEAGVASIAITNRTNIKTLGLVHALDRANVKAIEWDRVMQSTTTQPKTFEKPNANFDVIIHATSAALTGQSFGLQPTIAQHAQLAYDLSYSTQPTAFLTNMRALGCEQCVDGLGMLVEQAAQSFNLWLQLMPETQAVFDSLR